MAGSCAKDGAANKHTNDKRKEWKYFFMMILVCTEILNDQTHICEICLFDLRLKILLQDTLQNVASVS
jgi:hypothetical protein